MNSRISKSSITFLSLLIVLALIFVQKSVAFECFDCTDSIRGDCTDPFDSVKRGHFSIKCDDHERLPKDTSGKSKFKQSVGCRKIIQNVDGNVSVVRECAYSGGKMHGMKRMGNRGVRIFYYQCESDGCNTAKTTASAGPATIAILFLSLLAPVLIIM